ncbi:MAG: type II toxin-antitoxin system RelE/ParE family toxin [Nitrospiraceae bacterium]|nr:type II toxin-antitoxin system RelE/ParE family toxin [Nitrospiraceae bacterium]
MTFQIELAKEAQAGLESLYKSDRTLFRRILAKIETLMAKPQEGKPLVGNHKGEYSLRVGNYRIVYEIEYTKRIVYVLTVKHRKHVY